MSWGECMALLAQQVLPDGDVARFDTSQLPVHTGASGVGLEGGENVVQEGRIGLVLQVMQPLVRRRRGSGRSHARNVVHSPAPHPPPS